MVGCKKEILIFEMYWWLSEDPCAEWLKIQRTGNRDRRCEGMPLSTDENKKWGTRGRLCSACAVKVGLEW